MLVLQLKVLSFRHWVRQYNDVINPWELHAQSQVYKIKNSKLEIGVGVKGLNLTQKYKKTILIRLHNNDETHLLFLNTPRLILTVTRMNSPSLQISLHYIIVRREENK